MKIITWPVAALFIGVFGSVALTLIFATPDVAEAVLAILATVGTGVAAYLRSPLHAPIGSADVTTPETPSSKRKTVPPTVVLFLLVLTVPTVPACGLTWVEQGRHTLEALSVATNVADRSTADRVHEACDAAVADLTPGSEERAAAGAECRHQHGLDRAGPRIAAVDRALRVAQAELDIAAREDSEGRWRDALACLAEPVNALLDVLDRAQVPLTTQARSVLALFVGTADSCESGGTP